MGVFGREASLEKPAIVKPGVTQRALHGTVECGVVVDVDGVEGDSHQRPLDHDVVSEGEIEARRIESVDPVPQSQVWRSRLLCLKRHRSANCLGGRQGLAS